LRLSGRGLILEIPAQHFLVQWRFGIGNFVQDGDDRLRVGEELATSPPEDTPSEAKADEGYIANNNERKNHDARNPTPMVGRMEL
jgi:hypothetical protein